MSGPETPILTWSELMAAASLACDTGMGLPLETGLATCLVATRLAGRLGLPAADVERAYRLSLIEHIGCTVASSEVASVVGDELVMREHAAILDFSDSKEMFSFMLAHVARANPVLARPAALARAMTGGKRILATAADVCEAGQLLGRRCGYDADLLDDLAKVYESWDGSGFPNGVTGAEIPLPVQVVQVAALAVNAERLLGADAAAALVRGRSGHTLAPEVVNAFLADPECWSPLRAGDSLWDEVIATEPRPTDPPDDDAVDDALAALGDFADLKSPFLVGHSGAVSALAAEAAKCFGLGPDEVRLVRRAGWVHDLGRVAVSSRVWGLAKPLRPDDWERVRLHPYYSQQVLSRSPFLRTLSEVASSHHERLDGSGYFRGSPAAAQSVASRILAAADTYCTKTEERPHRAALTSSDAAAHLRAEAEAGRLDPLAVDAVLSAAGLATGPSSHPRLTAREIEILAAAAKGGSMREIARALSISPKTVNGHLQRIYPKIGVSTRGGATLYALEHGLLPRARMGENSP